MNKLDSKKLQKITSKLDNLIAELGNFEDKQRTKYNGLSDKQQESDKGESLGNVIDCLSDAISDLDSAYKNIDLAFRE